MMNFVTLLEQGNGWLFIPSAILLGALHGLEPGHSKTMMAAFIVAIKGTVKQAIMLGLAATLSHTIIVWLIAFGGMYISQRFTAEAAEPWMQLISGVIILATGLWMIWRTWSDERQWHNAQNYTQDWKTQVVDTGHGHIALSIVNEREICRLQLKTLSGKQLTADQVKFTLPETNSSNDQSHTFIDYEGYLESKQIANIKQGCMVKLMIEHHNHTHDFNVHFSPRIANEEAVYQDAHERSHAKDIEKRFANRTVTNGQILLFGLTGGLIPCPAAVTVLLICLQLKAVALGATLVMSFSIGLAITLVTVGVIAALSIQKASSKWSYLDKLARQAPYLSGLLIGFVGIYMCLHGYNGVMG